MKILLLTFSISNGGDFLIEERMNTLVKSTCKEHDVETMSGLKLISIEKFNEYDLIIAGGGPYYDDRVIRQLFMPLFRDIDKIVPPIHIIGSGVYGEDCLTEGINQKFFSDDVLTFCKKIEKKGGTLGCRDIVSYNVLKNNGLNAVYLTGCPAWYNMSFLDDTHICISQEKEINKIIISDPGVTKKLDEQEIRATQAIEVIKKVRELFPKAELSFSFNNGINTKYSYICNNIINDYLKDKNISVYDLSYEASKFSVYDDADLHIGFRVHSHIYSLSQRIPSILIEEDLRGYGMNETLALPHILSYNEVVMHQEGRYVPNSWLTKQLDDILHFILYTRFSTYEGTFCTMRSLYYNGYMKWLKKIGV